MKKLILITSLFFLSVLVNTAFAQEQKQTSNIYTILADNIDGKPVDFKVYKGKVLLIVNTASKCGFTPQYRDLEQLHEKYQAQGFQVLAFPSNDFKNQEPGSNAEIKSFCKSRFGVTFPLFSKISVSGATMHPLFSFLTTTGNAEMHGAVAWNFEKFLIDRKGMLRERFNSFTNPMSAKN